MAFFQTAPELEDPFSTDRVLRSYIARKFSGDARASVERALAALSTVVREELHPLQQRDRLKEPELTQWGPWGTRVDHIEVTDLWKRSAVLAAEHGLVATGYEKQYGALSRTAQWSLVYLFAPSCDVYTCPLAMTDGAAKTLLSHGNAPLVERAVTRLTSRDPKQMWTSGQWMTERTGGSDVGLSETVAVKDGERWRLHGTKWFSSATTSDMALTLARPEGNPPGGRGLALYYLELRDAKGALQNIRVNRLKDKLGTRKVPTAELSLEGAPATAVNGTSDGVRGIAPMLNITRTWNAVCAVSAMRRCLSLARDYARKRVAFGAPLSEKPLHTDTLAGLQAEFEAAFHLTFRVTELIGMDEHGEAGPHESALLRLLTPLVKLTTGKQTVAVASETLECFGGAGYVEDTGLPQLLRDAQVLPIWEGTTNVLSLDVLRVLAKPDALHAFAKEVHTLCESVTDDRLKTAVNTARSATANAVQWAESTAGSGDLRLLEAGARRFALTLGRTMELALLASHAQWSLDHENGDRRAAAAALRFAKSGVDLIGERDLDDSALLANDS